MRGRAFGVLAGFLAATLTQVAVHAAISAAGAHPFPIIGLAWLHLVAFWAGGYAGGRISRRVWPAAVPAVCIAAFLVGVDLLIDPGVSPSTLVFVALGLWINVWTARQAARAGGGPA